MQRVDFDSDPNVSHSIVCNPCQQFNLMPEGKQNYLLRMVNNLDNEAKDCKCIKSGECLRLFVCFVEFRYRKRPDCLLCEPTERKWEYTETDFITPRLVVEGILA